MKLYPWPNNFLGMDVVHVLFNMGLLLHSSLYLVGYYIPVRYSQGRNQTPAKLGTFH